MDVRLKFLGGAQSVTGSKYLLEIDDYTLLVDCGLFQGLKELRLRNWDDLPHPPQDINAILLTHAHLDHSGYVPRLVQQGFEGPIYCTEATADLLAILWMDAAKLQEEEAEFAKRKGYSKHENPLALFGQEDVEQALSRLKPIKFEHKLALKDQIHVQFYPSGHILGAASVELKLKGDSQEKTLLFSGDIGRQNDPLLPPPQQVQKADIVLMESTYGNRDNISIDTKEQLAEHILQHIEKGVVLIPAFTIGRTQNLMILLRELMENGLLPKVDVFIDSPMAISVTELYNVYSQLHKLEDKDIFNYKHFRYVRKNEQSNALQSLKKKAIIISASGMITGGRILSHLFHRLENEDDLLLFVGYQAEGTRGRKILEREATVKIYGEEKAVKCQLAKIDGLSAHADKAELLDWYKALEESPKYTFIVHGEKEAAFGLKDSLEKELNANNVFVPDYLESFELFNGI